MNISPLGILLFGSKATGEDTLRSDIDVCIVLGSKNNLVDEIRLAWQHVGGRYDLWLFEELPTYMDKSLTNLKYSVSVVYILNKIVTYVITIPIG